MDVETAFHFVGNIGRYQLFLTVILFLSNFCFSLQMVLMVVVGANVTVGNETYSNGTERTSIITDFDLNDRNWIVEMMQSLLMGGYIVGCIVFGQLSDSYGRRVPLVVCAFISSVIGFCSGLTTTWQAFAVTRFFTGIFLGGAGVIAFVILTETLGKKTWAAVGLLYQVFFSLGICFLALLGYLIYKWQQVCFVAGGVAIISTISIAIFVPESPRWLYATGKTEKAEELLRKIARKNGRDDRSIFLTPVTEHPTTNTFLDLFRHKKLVIWIIATCFIWFSAGFVYYGLTLSAANLTTDLYLGIALSGLVEIPATFACIFLMNFKWLGRKGALWIVFGLGAIANVISIFTYGNDVAKLVLELASKIAIAGAFNIIYVYFGEVYPTSLRAIAIGIASTAARVGAIIAPLFESTGDTKSYDPEGYVPYLVFGISLVVSFVLLFVLPETLGRPIPQTIEEVLDDDSYKPLVNEIEANRNLVDDTNTYS